MKRERERERDGGREGGEKGRKEAIYCSRISLGEANEWPEVDTKKKKEYFLRERPSVSTGGAQSARVPGLQ